MTDLQLATLLETIGNRLDPHLRFVYDHLKQLMKDDDADAVMLGVWGMRCDLYTQAASLRGELGLNIPELE